MKKALSILLTVLILAGSLSFAMADGVEGVKLWTVFTGDDGATIQALVDQFNAAYEGSIHVTHTPIDAENLYQSMYS